MVFSTAIANLVQLLHVGSRRFAATISKEMQLMQVAGNVSLNLPNSYVFQSKLTFFDIDRESHENQGKVHPFLRNAT